MQPELLRELITVDAFDRWLRVMAVVGVPIGVIVGCLAVHWWARRHRLASHAPRPARLWALGALTGLLGGALLPLTYGLWRFYLWRIRIDLDRDFVGLHRVDVLLGNVVLFVGVGAAVGLVGRLYAAWLRRQLSR